MTPPNQPRLFEDQDAQSTDAPVECLGMTFESDEARRAYFLPAAHLDSQR